jgi:hypothetical protein
MIMFTCQLSTQRSALSVHQPQPQCQLQQQPQQALATITTINGKPPELLFFVLLLFIFTCYLF